MHCKKKSKQLPTVLRFQLSGSTRESKEMLPLEFRGLGFIPSCCHFFFLYNLTTLGVAKLAKKFSKGEYQLK